MKKYWNNQKYCECKLVTLWNAAIYHNIKILDRYGDEYITDCKKAGAIYGGCIDSDYIIKKLGLKPSQGYLNWNWIKMNCPIEFSIFCHRGYHSVLAVDINLKNKKVLLTNYAKNRVFWVKINNLIEMQNKHIYPIKWILNII